MSQAGVNRDQPAVPAAGHHWGNYASEAALPNVSADALDVRPGDLACVGSQLYVCRLSASGSAAWDAMGGNEGPTRVLSHALAFDAALAAQGTDAAAAAATDVDVVEFHLPYRKSVTGIAFLNGTITGTDNVRGLIYDSDGSFIVGTPTLGVLSGTADVFQECPLTAVTVLEPGRYWIGLKLNGTTAAHQRAGAAALGRLAARIGGQTFAGNTDITPPTTYTAARAPICYLY